MAEIRFSERDGPIHLQLGANHTVVQGSGTLSYTTALGLPSRSGTHVRVMDKLDRLEKSLRWVVLASAVVGLVFWIWKIAAGTGGPAFLSVGANVFKFALVGSIVSLGGVNLVSLRGRVESTRQLVATQRIGCPFESLFTGQEDALAQPGNPNFCVKCPLGIDTIPDEDRGFLMHDCLVYLDLHRRWRARPDALRWLHRRGMLK